MIILIIIIGLVIVNQLLYWLKLFVKEEYKELYDSENPCVYYCNNYFGIAFMDITKDFRLFGWQWGKGIDKCIFICGMSITLKFLMG